MANRGQIRALVLRTLQRAGVSSTETGDVDTWIDETIREELCPVVDWPGMFAVDTISTVAGTEEYTFGAGSPGFSATRFKQCKLIQCRESASDEWEDLTPVALPALLLNWSEVSTSRGRPNAEWALSDEDSFKVRPIPDAVYSLRCQCIIYPAAFTGDSDTNFFTTKFAGLLVQRVAVRAAMSVGQAGKVALIDEPSLKRLQALTTDERSKAKPHHARMRLSVAAGRLSRGVSRGRRVFDGYGYFR